jgi:hypothetical protein
MGSHSCAGRDSLTAEMSLTPMNLPASARGSPRARQRRGKELPLEDANKDGELALVGLVAVDLDGLGGLVKRWCCCHCVGDVHVGELTG